MREQNFDCRLLEHTQFWRVALFGLIACTYERYTKLRNYFHFIVQVYIRLYKLLYFSKLYTMCVQWCTMKKNYGQLIYVCLIARILFSSLQLFLCIYEKAALTFFIRAYTHTHCFCCFFWWWWRRWCNVSNSHIQHKDSFRPVVYALIHFTSPFLDGFLYSLWLCVAYLLLLFWFVLWVCVAVQGFFIYEMVIA